MAKILEHLMCLFLSLLVCSNFEKSKLWDLRTTCTRRRPVACWSVVKYGISQGQSGQAIKLFQASGKNSFTFHFDTRLSSLSLMMWNLQSYPTTVLNERMWHFRRSKHTLTPPSYFQGSGPPTPRIYAPAPRLRHTRIRRPRFRSTNTSRITGRYC